MTTTSLPALLASTGYLLAYALPLLVLSVPLTFAGAFLTLDRTRVFAPRSDAGFEADLPDISASRRRRRRFLLLLEGGLGGLVGGYLFGLHLATFLAVLIPSVTSAGALGPKSFVAVWFLSAAPMTFLGARWRYAALPILGLTGGATLALALSVIVHPPLLARIIFVAVLGPILCLLCTLPIAVTQHACVRFASAAAGAFGIVLSIALLARVATWEGVWSRLWVSDGPGWDSAPEKGLSAAFCLFLAAGTAADWLLHRRFGEDPGEKWDSYLATYAEALPNAAGRAGVFEPLSSPFARLLRKPRAPPFARVPGGDDVFSADLGLDRDAKAPGDGDGDAPPPYPPRPAKHQHRRLSTAKAGLDSPPAFEYAPRPGFLQKKSTRRISGGRKREGIKFRPLEDADASSDSDSDASGTLTKAVAAKPWLAHATSAASLSAASGTTLNDDLARGKADSKDDGSLDIAKERAALAARKAGAPDAGAPDYSDYESDGGSAASHARRRASRGQPGWQPDFLRGGSSGGLTTPRGSAGAGGGAPSGLSSAARSVPATPSLIRAIDRLAAAQASAYGFPAVADGGGDPAVTVPHPPAPAAEDEAGAEGERRAGFWRDVKAKAAQR